MINKLLQQIGNQDVNNILPNIGPEDSSLYVPDR